MYYLYNVSDILLSNIDDIYIISIYHHHHYYAILSIILSSFILVDDIDF